MTYSVAIRTLGTSGDALRRELISLHNQTVAPEKIVIYIAAGYTRPDFRVGIEEYVEVEKGMVSQRALPYSEIASDCIMLLDDDVEFAPDSAEILLRQFEENQADCVAADTFANHEMSVTAKLRAAITGLVFPHFSQKWAFKLHSNGSFSYINNPKRGIYPSQSAAGPASLWKRSSLLAMRFEDEKWLDSLGFAYGDDDLEFYKLHINGGRLFVSFNSGIRNLDSKSSSSVFQQDERKFYVRSMSNTVRWYRMHFEIRHSKYRRIAAKTSYAFKIAWLGIIHIVLSTLK
ncbi:MAG: glycosyltransferase, partial [Muribaculaceae bacterium]|nr:glycosyltransferase [Muribaculaceae bacterium]